MFRIIRVSSLVVMLLLVAVSGVAAAEATPPAGKGVKKPPPSEPKPPGVSTPGSSNPAGLVADDAENQGTNDAAYIKFDVQPSESWKVEEISPDVSDNGADGGHEQDGLPGATITTNRILCGENRPCSPRILRAIRERADWGSSSEECPVNEAGCPEGYHWVVVEVCDVDEEGNESGCELIYDCVEDQASSSLESIGTFAGIATSPLGLTEEAPTPKRSEAIKGLGGAPPGNRKS